MKEMHRALAARVQRLYLTSSARFDARAQQPVHFVWEEDESVAALPCRSSPAQVSSHGRPHPRTRAEPEHSLCGVCRISWRLVKRLIGGVAIFSWVNLVVLKSGAPNDQNHYRLRLLQEVVRSSTHNRLYRVLEPYCVEYFHLFPTWC